MFSYAEDFLTEEFIYMLHEKAGIEGVPCCLGSFQNSWMGMDALLIPYEGLPLKGEQKVTLSSCESFIHLFSFLPTLS